MKVDAAAALSNGNKREGRPGSKGQPHLTPELQLFSEEARERIIAFKTNPRMYRALAEE